jgi:DNA-binding transcriptional ArsR family regulator
MTEKYVSIDINDPRSTKIAEALSNPTSKKILNLLADKELSASDISNLLKQPLNTITYNLDKLVETGLIEKSKNFFWSAKGKKIPTYTLSNKKIMISPKTITKGILPALLGTAIVALGINYLSTINNVSKVADVAQESYSTSSGAALVATNELAKIAPQYCKPIVQACTSQPLWAYFLLGALTLALIYLLWNSFSHKLKGGNLK